MPRSSLNIAAVAALCIGLAWIGVVVLSDPEIVNQLGKQGGAGSGAKRSLRSNATTAKTIAAETNKSSAIAEVEFPLFSASNFETAGFGVANRVMAPVQDQGSLTQVYEAIATRATRDRALLARTALHSAGCA